MSARTVLAVLGFALALLGVHGAVVAAAAVTVAAAGAVCLCCRRLHREGVLPWT